LHGYREEMMMGSTERRRRQQQQQRQRSATSGDRLFVPVKAMADRPDRRTPGAARKANKTRAQGPARSYLCFDAGPGWMDGCGHTQLTCRSILQQQQQQQQQDQVGIVGIARTMASMVIGAELRSGVEHEGTDADKRMAQDKDKSKQRESSQSVQD